MKNRRGFTLIELIVVIMIIGILATLVIPNVLSHIAESKVAKAESDIAALHQALDTFHIDNDRYPTEQEGLNALVEQPSSNVKNWKPYIPSLPNDPWGSPYIYKYPGPKGNDTFLLESYGPSGQEGGTGDNSAIIDGQF
jgi:general secretion pathway protein G